MDHIDEIESKINENTKMIWVETPTNPMLNIIDIAAICELAKKYKLLVCVDNTFASPYLQNPLDLGADIVLHSATKYLGGHSDVVHGAVIVKDKALADSLYFLQNAVGAVPGPQDCFLLLRGIKTLHLRVERACQNARKIADFLQSHPKVDRIYYPGFPTHKGHQIAAKQMRDFGAMISFSLKDDTLEAASKLLKKVHYFTCAESLGGVESLIGHPATMTHASIPREQRMANGLTDSLIRISVGIEDVEDLIADLKFALD
jgi:cystathionine beta-lyase